MKEPDKDKFIAAMVEEMHAQCNGKNFLRILRSKVSKVPLSSQQSGK